MIILIQIKKNDHVDFGDDLVYDDDNKSFFDQQLYENLNQQANQVVLRTTYAIFDVSITREAQ